MLYTPWESTEQYRYMRDLQEAQYKKQVKSLGQNLGMLIRDDGDAIRDIFNQTIFADIFFTLSEEQKLSILQNIGYSALARYFTKAFDYSLVLDDSGGSVHYRGSFATSIIENDKQHILLEMPKDLRFIDSTPTENLFVIEKEPGIYPIYTPRRYKKYPAQISMPWQYFTVVTTREGAIKQLLLCWTLKRAKSLENFDTPTYLPLVPNVSGDSICLGTNFYMDISIPLHQRINLLIDSFYSPYLTFTRDLGWNRPRGITSFIQYERFSQRNPQWYETYLPNFGRRTKLLLNQSAGGRVNVLPKFATSVRRNFASNDNQYNWR